LWRVIVSLGDRFLRHEVLRPGREMALLERVRWMIEAA
jgi:hypothetical protein